MFMAATTARARSTFSSVRGQRQRGHGQRLAAEQSLQLQAARGTGTP
jgi:hypothetical protein